MATPSVKTRPQRGQRWLLSSAIALVLAALAFAGIGQTRLFVQRSPGRLSFQAPERRSVCMKGSRTTFPSASCATGKLQDLKAQLREAPTVEAVTALEAEQKGGIAVRDIADLAGIWELWSQPQDWSHGSPDILRSVLDLYRGKIGKVLNMELVSNPKVLITPVGHVETASRLRWGPQQDEVVVFSELSMVAPGRLREAPKEVRSEMLKLSLATGGLQRAREIDITYFDGDILIARDMNGHIDVLTRSVPRRRAPSQDAVAPQADLPAAPESRKLHRARRSPRALRVPAEVKPTFPDDDDDESMETEVGPAVPLDEDEFAAAFPDEDEDKAKEDSEEQPANPLLEAMTLQKRVEELKTFMEAQRQQAEKDSAERARLRAEIERVEKAMEESSLGTKVEWLKLGAMDDMNTQLSKTFETQKEKTEEQVRARAQLRAETEALKVGVNELEAQIKSNVAREKALEIQLKGFETDLRTGPRELWPGLRGAIKRGKEELSQVHQAIKDGKKEEAAKKRELDQKTMALEKGADTVRGEELLTEKMEGELIDRHTDATRQRESWNAAAFKVERLSKQLEELRAQLDVVEAREASSREEASSVEAEVGALIVQAEQVRDLGRSLREEPRRGWPFGR